MGDDLLAVYRAGLGICGLGLAIRTAELLVVPRPFAASGLLAWRVLRLRSYVPRPLRTPALDGVLSRGGVRAFLIGRLGLLLGALALPVGSGWFSAALALLVVSDLLFTFRRVYGTDGADQMTTVVLGATLLCAGPHSTRFSLIAGLAFIALQASLAYGTSAVAKLASPVWRSGEALPQILGTETYGCAWLARLAARPAVSRALGWGVITGELVLAVAILLPAPLNLAVLAGGVLFHAQCALVMGLNRFLWAFVSTYPAILCVGSLIQQGWGG